MAPSWIVAHPDWYASERRLLAQHYPSFWIDEPKLADGLLILYGELVVRPPGGAQRYPVMLEYPAATPYEKPSVVPLEELPVPNDQGGAQSLPRPKAYDHRHQMPGGELCLFQRETRADPLGDMVSGVDALRRAAKWFLGLHTGQWPPDSAESELEAHFRHGSDVLLGSALYNDSRLNGGWGRLLFSYDYRRRIEDRTAIPPMIVTSVTVDSGPIQFVVDSRDELARVYPWIRAEAWNPLGVLTSNAQGSDQFDHVEQGYWWSLPSEPRPFSTGKGLLRELGGAFPEHDPWNTLKAALGTDFTTKPKVVIGLRYPGRHGEVEWLVVLVLLGQRQAGGAYIIESETEQRRRFESAQVFGIRAHTLRPSELWLRNTSVVGDGVAAKRVGLIGLGALGSVVAERLAQAGVGGFRLCDMDTLAVGNVARHVAGITQFGAAKTRAVASRLLEINPRLELDQDDLIQWSATVSPTKLAAMMETVDLIVSTTADEGTESLINEVAIWVGKPVLYGRSLRRASIGRVFLVRPGRDACKACLAIYAHAGRAGEPVPPAWIDVREGAEDVLLHECGRPVIPGSGIDLSFIASLIAREALSVLEGKDEDANHWLWAKDAMPDIDPRLRPLSTYIARLEPLMDCPVCSAPQIRAAILPDSVRAQIVQQTESSITAETGGILLGYLDGRGQAIVTRATGPGPEAIHSATRFHRDVVFVQAELDRALNELGEQGAYLGEWHSHLVPDPEPSATDIDSLFGIAEAPNYLTGNPVLIIAGLDRATGHCEKLKGWVFQRGGSMYPLELVESLAADRQSTD